MNDIVLMYDPEIKAVGCVLIQAACGCDSHNVHRLGFHTNSWFLAPTPGMKRLKATREQWDYVVKITNEKWKDKSVTR